MAARILLSIDLGLVIGLNLIDGRDIWLSPNTHLNVQLSIVFATCLLFFSLLSILLHHIKYSTLCLFLTFLSQLCYHSFGLLYSLSTNYIIISSTSLFLSLSALILLLRRLRQNL